MKKKISNLDKRIGKKILASTAGKATSSFLADDRIYIITLAISGILLLLSRFGIGKLLSDIYFSLFFIILAMTLVSYSYLRLIRNKKYSEKENQGIMIAAIWIVASLISWIILMVVVLFFINNILKIFNVANRYNMLYIFWYMLTLMAGGFTLWKLHLWKGLRIKQFIMLVIDGLAWIIAVGGIGALAVLDVLYSVLLLLDHIGMVY